MKNLSKFLDYLINFYTLEDIEYFTNNEPIKIKELYDETQPQIVEIRSLENNYENCLVTSPDGWVPVIDCVKKAPKDILTVEMNNSLIVNSSTDHLFQKSNEEWIYSRDLSIGDELITDGGISTVKRIIPYGKEEVYDLSIDHPNHRYYTNNICSHNTGKSLFLQNLAVNWVLQGLNIIYITLELSENLVSLRLDAMFTEISTKNVIKDVDSTALKLMAIAQGKKATVKPGRLQVKKMSEAGTTVNDIRAYIKEYEIQTGLKVHGICLDYLDLLYPNSAKVDINSTFTKDKYTSEELRGLAAELNILCVSASQLNRCLAMDTEVTYIDLEESTSISNFKLRKKKIEDVQIGDWVLGQNDFVEVTNIFHQGKQQLYKITLENGSTIKCTSNHRFPSDKGMRSMDTGLEVGMALYHFERYFPTRKNMTHVVHTRTNLVKIASIEDCGIEETMDIEVFSENHLFFGNDILTHNSSVQETDYDVSHIAGGISKINTADNVIAILTNSALRENGEYQIQFLKTRSSSGVGSRLYLGFNSVSLKISDKLEGNGNTDTSKLTALAQAKLKANQVEKKIPESPKIDKEKTSSIVSVEKDTKTPNVVTTTTDKEKEERLAMIKRLAKK